MQKLLKALSVRRIISIVLFDLVWFLAVWGRTELIVLTLICVVLLYLMNGKRLWQQRLYIALFIMLGLLAEFALVALGILSFTQANFLPLWLVVLWIGFAATAFTSMDWMARRYAIATIFGVVFGPVTYLAGIKFGAAELIVGKGLMLASYGIMWALLMIFFARFVTNQSR